MTLYFDRIEYKVFDIQSQHQACNIFRKRFHMAFSYPLHIYKDTCSYKTGNVMSLYCNGDVSFKDMHSTLPVCDGYLTDGSGMYSAAKKSNYHLKILPVDF